MTPRRGVGRLFDDPALVVPHHSLANLGKDEEKDEAANDESCNQDPVVHVHRDHG